MSTFRCVSVLSWLVLCAVGCDSASDRYEVYPATGRVTYRGAPAEGAEVVLYSTEQIDPKRPIPKATVQADGTFHVTSYEEGDGAPAGTYKVTVKWLEPIPAGADPETFPPVDRLGGRYSIPDRSDIEVTVAEGDNEFQPFELK